MGKRTDRSRHSYRGDLVGQGFVRARQKKPSPKTDRDAVENTLADDSMIDQISGDPYLANLIRKHQQE